MRLILFLIFICIVSGCSQLAYKKGKEAFNKKDYIKAAHFYKIAAQNGDPKAQNNLAGMFREGLGIKQNNRKAVMWYTKAVRQGSASATYNLAYMVRYGLGTKKDPILAIKLYIDATKKDYLLAYLPLGDMYEKGEGTSKNYSMAVKCYEKLANTGNKNAQFHLALMFKNGFGVKKDFNEALRLINLSANAKYAPAEYYLGYGYTFGKYGCEKNYDKAIRWLTKASNQNYASGQNTLAWLLCKKKENLEEANKLIKKALQKESKNPLFIDTYGWILYKQKKYDKSLVQLKKASKLAPKDADIRDHLGDTYSALSKTIEAKEQWQKAFELTKDEELKKKLKTKLNQPTPKTKGKNGARKNGASIN